MTYIDILLERVGSTASFVPGVLNCPNSHSETIHVTARKLSVVTKEQMTAKSWEKSVWALPLCSYTSLSVGWALATVPMALGC